MIAPAHLVTAILAFVVIALPTRDAATQERKKSFIRLPSGAEVRIQGQAATAMMPTGIAGSFDCQCKGDGTCTVESTKGGLACYKGSKDTCNSDCELSVTTSGLTGGAAPTAVSPGSGTVKPKAPKGAITTAPANRQ
jgi:hypothetical protein